MLQKYNVADLLNFYAIYDTQNADNAKTLRVWFGDKLLNFVQQTTLLSEGDSGVCS